jgi:class 3 adenylate cyclase
MDIAYQVIGDGAHDLVVLPSALISIDSIAAEPSMNRFHQRLASFCRVIRFDHRGMGLSSRVPSIDVIGPQFWAEDAIAVMDAVGCPKATIFVSGWASMNGLVLAANYPDRVNGLVIVNGFARFSWAADYPFGAKLSQSTALTTVVYELDAVEQGVDALEWEAPSVAGVEAFRTWWDLAGNRAASPTMARAVGTVAANGDVRDVLDRITAPTLILHRRGCAFIPPGHGRYLAERITQSTYVELPGADMLYWVGDTAELLDEVEEFVTGVRGGAGCDRVVATILFTDIVGSTERAATLGDDRWHGLLDNHDSIIRHQLERFGGREVNTVGDGFLAVFSSPSVAIDCAAAIVAAMHPFGIEVRTGIHIGEVEVRGGDVAGMAVHIGARIAALAAPSEVLVSSTVREIVTGSRRVFHARGEHELKGVPGRWRLYAA